MQKEIKIKVYYGYDDNENVLIDEDSIREEFEHKLKKVIEEAKEYRK